MRNAGRPPPRLKPCETGPPKREPPLYGFEPNAGRLDEEYPPRLELPPNGREDEDGLYGFDPNGFDAPKEGFPNGLPGGVPKVFEGEKDELRCHGLLLDA